MFNSAILGADADNPVKSPRIRSCRTRLARAKLRYKNLYFCKTSFDRFFFSTDDSFSLRLANAVAVLLDVSDSWGHPICFRSVQTKHTIRYVILKSIDNLWLTLCLSQRETRQYQNNCFRKKSLWNFILRVISTFVCFSQYNSIWNINFFLPLANGIYTLISLFF